LVKHNKLKEIDISNNMISYIGLRCLKKLKQCENIKKISIYGNYGLSDETLHELNGLPINY
jgi:CO dehydrogenase/acetyl-CoA synthase epsilon subunit